MDVNIRYWDEKEDEVPTRYLTSIFLNHAAAVDLVLALKTAMAGLDLKKLLQVSMDGPSVNFKAISLLKKELVKDPDDPQLIEIGSCGLHALHCAFKNGIKATG